VWRLLHTPNAVGRAFNIGTNEEVSIARLAEIVRDAAGSDSPIERVPYEQAYIEGFEDMYRRIPDLSCLERTISFRPRTPLMDIVADVIAYQRGQASAAGAVVPTLQPATP
jgi:UDP-glucose 4-epimerase